MRDDRLTSGPHPSMVSLDAQSMLAGEGGANAGTLYQMNQPLLNNTTDNFDGSQSQGSESSRLAKTALKSVDKLKDKQEAIEKRLTCRFMTYMAFMVAAQSMNTFFVIFHMLDSEDSDETLRY